MTLLGRGRDGERGKTEVWDLEVSQLTFKDKLLGNNVKTADPVARFCVLSIFFVTCEKEIRL